jgi:hypothetical protein
LSSYEKKCFKTLVYHFSLPSVFTTTVFAKKKSETEKLKLHQRLNVTPQELAAIYVLSEICPRFIGKD